MEVPPIVQTFSVLLNLNPATLVIAFLFGVIVRYTLKNYKSENRKEPSEIDITAQSLIIGFLSFFALFLPLAVFLSQKIINNSVVNPLDKGLLYLYGLSFPTAETILQIFISGTGIALLYIYKTAKSKTRTKYQKLIELYWKITSVFLIILATQFFFWILFGLMSWTYPDQIRPYDTHWQILDISLVVASLYLANLGKKILKKI